MTSVASAFVGCKVSQADGEEALAELAAAGLRPASSREAADVVVVHTCCVTAEAERKSRRLVRRVAGDGRRVVVAGCAAALRPDQFDGPGVEVVARPDWAAVAAASGTRTRAAASVDRGSLQGASAVALGTKDSAEGVRASRPSAARTRHVLKVQDGCSGSCSYCAVRLARGRPRSTPLQDAVAAARAAVAEGCGEFVLSGIDLGAWCDDDLRLPDLVLALVKLPGLARVRLSSLEPRHLDERLLAALGHPRVARHLHVPLQSADDGVLATMLRPYTFAQYAAAAARIRAALGDCMLSTDVIVGFPTEDDAAFGRTLAALESGLFGRVHVFAYSSRPGTAAAELPPLPAALVKERMGRALAAAGAAARSARRAALGRPAEVLVEERREGLWRGYSSEYVRFYLDGVAVPGSLVHSRGLRRIRGWSERTHRMRELGVIEQRIKDDSTAALRAGDKRLREALSQFVAALKKERIDSRAEPTEAEQLHGAQARAQAACGGHRAVRGGGSQRPRRPGALRGRAPASRTCPRSSAMRSSRSSWTRPSRPPTRSRPGTWAR